MPRRASAPPRTSPPSCSTALTGAKIVHVPYRGTGPALNDIVAGHVDLIFMELSAAYKLHEGGKARILAVATDKRLELLPNIPTMIEVGVPSFISDTWNAISAPPKTPAPIIAKLNRTINDIINDPETKSRFKELNLIAGGRHPRRHGQAEERRDRALDQGDPRRGIQPESESTPGLADSRYDDVRRELVLDEGDAVAQIELALLEPLHLQHVGAVRVLQRRDGGIEVAVLLLEARPLLPQLAFFLFGHRRRWFEAGRTPC